MLNLNGKYRYVSDLIKNYSDWYKIIIGRVAGKSPRSITLRNGIKISGGPKSEISDLSDEIFFQKVYTPKFKSIKSGDIVLDIGANIGVFSLFAAFNGAKRIVSVEPLPANIKQIQKNFRLNKIDLPETIQMAVDGRTGKAKLYLGDIDSHNLLFDRNYRNEKFDKHIMVPVITLSDILKKEKISRIDFLKMDCEGSEGEIISSTPLSIWKKISKVAIEYHDGVSSLDHNEISRRLKKFGYKIVVKKIDDNFGYIYAF